MPPADAATAASVLWLHASENVPSELGPMIFDFAGESSLTEPTHLLLLGLKQVWMDRLNAIAKSARLKIMAVRPSGEAIAAATSPHLENGLILSLYGLLILNLRDLNSISAIAIPRSQSGNRSIEPSKSIEFDKSIGKSSANSWESIDY